MIGENHSPELLIEPVVGFRSWRLRDGCLESPFIRVQWKRRMTAECLSQWWTKQPVARCAESPGFNHNCGLYAYYRPSDCGSSSQGYERNVWGAVVAWGATEAHSLGFRAQHMEVVALASPARRHGVGRRTLRGVAEGLGVPVVRVSELEGAALSHGAPLPEDLRPAPTRWDLYRHQPEVSYWVRRQRASAAFWAVCDWVRDTAWYLR